MSELPTDYCPQCCVVHVTCECPYEDETRAEYWARMDRIAAKEHRFAPADHIDEAEHYYGVE